METNLSEKMHLKGVPGTVNCDKFISVANLDPRRSSHFGLKLVIELSIKTNSTLK